MRMSKPVVTASPDVMGGTPVVLRDFPSLTRDHIRAVLAYAAERERRYATHSVA